MALAYSRGRLIAFARRRAGGRCDDMPISLLDCRQRLAIMTDTAASQPPAILLATASPPPSSRCSTGRRSGWRRRRRHILSCLGERYAATLRPSILSI